MDFNLPGAGRNIDEAGKPAIIEYGEYSTGFLAAADRRYLAASSRSTAGALPALCDTWVPESGNSATSVSIW
ncbi:MAG: hypothetical protein U5K72_03575 [Balneolaceae bacterium]|nr:hypothetical protein [Balneolaceae bacterium]